MADFEMFEAEQDEPDESEIMTNLDSLATDLFGMPSADTGYHSSDAYSSRLGYARLVRSAWIEQSLITSYFVEGTHFTGTGEDRVVTLADELELPEDMDDADKETLEMIESIKDLTSIRILGGIATTIMFDTRNLSIEKTVSNSRLVIGMDGHIDLESIGNFSEGEDDNGFKSLIYADLMTLADIRSILAADTPAF